MWKRVTSLATLISSNKSSIFNQARHGVSSQDRTPFITFVLGTSKLLSPNCNWLQLLLKEENYHLVSTADGGPGSGKGTQCEKIVEAFGFKHLSAGDLLRREIASNSEYGSKILNTIKEGRIVPSEVTVKLIQREMESSDNHKFLIDGFPRSEENRMAFEQIIGAEPSIVLFFDCPEEEMVKRVLSRNQGRVDDNLETIKKRLKVFEALNLPVISHYAEKGNLYKVSAVGTVDEIFEQIRPVFAACEQLIR